MTKFGLDFTFLDGHDNDGKLVFPLSEEKLTETSDHILMGPARLANTSHEANVVFVFCKATKRISFKAWTKAINEFDSITLDYGRHFQLEQCLCNLCYASKQTHHKNGRTMPHRPGDYPDLVRKREDEARSNLYGSKRKAGADVKRMKYTE